MQRLSPKALYLAEFIGKMKILVLSPANQGVKNVVRDFMYGCWCAGRRIGGMQMPPLNLLFVATALKEDGHDVALIDAGVDYDSYERVKSDIADFDAVIVLTSSHSFKLDTASCRELKNLNPGLKTIFFGSHPTFMPESCLREDSVDIIVRREPELIIRDVCRRLRHGEDWRTLKGIGYRESDGVVLNEFYPFIQNMDDLPIPDRSLLPKGIDYFNPVVKRVPYTTAQTSRGCPSKCNFCTAPSFFGRRVRYRSAEKVVAEFRQLSALGFKEIFIRDETFTAYKKRNLEICKGLIENNLDIGWICNARTDMIDEETVIAMKRAGCHLLKFGVESGSQTILDNIHKDITLGQTREAFALCKKHRIDAHAHVMIGCIGENADTLKKTIQFVKQIDPTTASFGIFTPYPGAEVFEYVAHRHPEIADGAGADLTKLHITGFFNDSFCDLTRPELENGVRKAYRQFYFRPAYLAKRLLAIRSAGELIRYMIAASNIFSFGLSGKN